MLKERGLNMKRGTKAALSGVLALAVLALCAGPGFAQSTTSTSGSNSAANANSGSASIAGANSNQRQLQGQSVTYQETTPANQTIKNVPNVYGPGLAAAGSEVCLGSVSAGGAGAGFGLTVGGTIVDQECQLRMNARTLATLGYAKAAREEMCLDAQVRSAMMAAGTPCATDEPAKPQATAEYGAPAAVELSSVPGTPNRGCYKTYQLLGGWHDVCPPGAVAANPPAADLSAQFVAQASEPVAQAPQPIAQASQDLAPAAAPGCVQKYQLIGGWYPECK